MVCKRGKMKRILMGLLIFVVNALASSEYDFKYNVYAKGKKVGTLNAVCIQEGKGLYKYSNHWDITSEQLLTESTYSYKEFALVNKGKLISLLAYETEDGIKQEVTLLASNNTLVYPHGARVKLSSMDYFPFDFKANIFKNLKKKKFLLKTFDVFSGKILNQKIKLIDTVFFKNQKGFTFKLDDKTTKSYLKDGSVIQLSSQKYTAIRN